MKRDQKGRFMSEGKTPGELYLHEQVSRLDREMATLATSQTSLVDTVGELASTISTLSTEMRQGFSRLAEDKVNASKTNWQTITSIASVFVLIVAGLYGLVSSNAAEGRASNEESINEVKQLFNQHTRGGHPDSVIERIDALRDTMDKQLFQVNSKAERALLDLQSRSDKRFNREDHDKYNVPRFEQIEDQVRVLQLASGSKERFTRSDWNHELQKLMTILNSRQAWMERQTQIDAKQTADIIWLVEKVSDLKRTMERIAKLETQVGIIHSEQQRRSEKVYSK